MRYNSSLDSAAQILVYNRAREIHPTAKQIDFVRIVGKTGHSKIVRFTTLWVGNVANVEFRTTSHFMSKKNIHKINERSKRINKDEKSETTDQSDIQNVRFINCNKQYSSEYDS